MTYDFPECEGCRTCELACSFHFTGDFNVKNSCIKIIENENKCTGGFLINFSEEEDNIPFECNCCLNMGGDPLCVQYCIQTEKLIELIHKHASYKK